MKPAKKGQFPSPAPGFFARLSARQRIISGAVLIVVCTIIAFSARPSDSDRPAGSIVAWLFRPLDPFSQARKPYIRSDLRAIARVPGSKTLIAVGSGGLIVRSNDLGRNWEPQIVRLTPEEIRRLQGVNRISGRGRKKSPKRSNRKKPTAQPSQKKLPERKKPVNTMPATNRPGRAGFRTLYHRRSRSSCRIPWAGIKQ
jgi:hypothetical protein